MDSEEDVEAGAQDGEGASGVIVEIVGVVDIEEAGGAEEEAVEEDMMIMAEMIDMEVVEITIEMEEMVFEGAGETPSGAEVAAVVEEEAEEVEGVSTTAQGTVPDHLLEARDANANSTLFKV